MMTVLSQSVEATIALGGEWGRAARSGWLVGISGPLGAGKTQLIKGIARGLKVAGRVSSPTFTLVHEHMDGTLPLYHLDLYRLEGTAQILGAGVEPYFYQRNGVTVVEWFERWLEVEPAFLQSRRSPARRVIIDPKADAERRIQYEDFGV